MEKLCRTCAQARLAMVANGEDSLANRIGVAKHVLVVDNKAQTSKIRQAKAELNHLCALWATTCSLLSAQHRTG